MSTFLIDVVLLVPSDSRTLGNLFTLRCHFPTGFFIVQLTMKKDNVRPSNKMQHLLTIYLHILINFKMSFNRLTIKRSLWIIATLSPLWKSQLNLTNGSQSGMIIALFFSHLLLNLCKQKISIPSFFNGVS